MPNEFESLFPGFVNACVELHDAFVPLALVILVGSFGFLPWHGSASGVDMVRFLVRLFLIVLLITRAHLLINDGQTIIDGFVQRHVSARPENLVARYQQKLAEAQAAKEREDQGFFARMFGASLFESLIAAVLTLVTWAGSATVYFVFLLQKVALLLAWTLSPVLFALFAIPPLSNLAMRHVLRIFGLLLWPIGLALAATVSEGILDGMVRDGFLREVTFLGTIGYGLNNLLALAVLAVWVAISSIAAPLYIQRMVAGGATAAGLLTRGGDLAANVGGPTLFTLAGEAWGYARGRLARPAPYQPFAHAASRVGHMYGRPSQSERDNPSPMREPVPAMPVDTPEPGLTNLAAQYAPPSSQDSQEWEARIQEAVDQLKPTT